ncbi:unnamed protein product [Prunus brigantina]
MTKSIGKGNGSLNKPDKEIYETDNDVALDDNNEFDVNLQSNFGRVGNTYLPKDFVAAACEEDSDTKFEKELDSPYYSSDEEGERRRKFPEFCMSDLDNPKFERGMLFGSKEVLKKVVQNYAVQGNYHIKFVKNDKRRITAQCKNCTWKIHASFMQLEKTLQIKTFIDKHICHRNLTNPYVNCVFIAHKYLDRIMDKPDIKCKHLRKAVRRDLGYNVFDSQCARAKNKAKEIIEGTYKEQYSRLQEYCDEIRATNVGSTMKIRVEPPPHFQRLYICLDACKKGFLACLGVDANDNTYSIAYAAMELETKETWSWFLELLINDLGPGLDRAFDVVVPQAQHRWCVRHMYGNFKDKFKGKGLKDLLWSAVRASNRYEFEVEMNKLKDMNGAAYDWLMSKDLDKWARHRFSTAPKCDMLLNNLCETFNSYILTARDKPILTMLEMIRCNIMKRFQMNRETMSKHKGSFAQRFKRSWRRLNIS